MITLLNIKSGEFQHILSFMRLVFDLDKHFSYWFIIFTYYLGFNHIY